MKIAALLCGLLGGLFALSAWLVLGGDLQPAFLALWAPTNSQQFVGKLVWYAVPGAALFGGLLALLAPGIAALILLAAALGWLAIGLVLPQGMDYQLALPMGLATIGAIFAFIAGEASIRRRRMERRERQATLKAVDSEALAREDALRLEPQFPARQEAIRQRPETIRQRLPELPLDLDGAPPAPVQRAAPGRVMASVAEPTFQREPQQNGNRLLVTLVGVTGVAAILLAGMVGWMLYRSGQFATVFDPGTKPPAVEAKIEPAKVPSAPAIPAQLADAEPELVTRPASSESVAAAVPAALTDPFSYCAAVKTVDYLDNRYAGPRLTARIAAALGIPVLTAPDRVSWRCVDGAVLACQSFDWPSCAMTPTVAEMVAYCKGQPEVDRLFAPNGAWSCRNGKPVIPPDASWPIDERGFYPSAWIEVTPSDAPPDGGLGADTPG